jgi:tetratricopeptide (TPR) repeat protein
MRMQAGRKSFVSIALLCCSWALQVGAQPSAASGYDELVARGVSAFEAGRYTEARELLQRAHLLYPNARTLRGMGLAAFEAEDYAQAGQDFERALAETQNPLDDAQRAELERLQAEADARTARFRLIGQLPGSVLRVDGDPPLMDLAGFLLMDAGTHTVSLQLAGGEERTLALQAEGGQWSDLDLSAARGPESKNPWVLVAGSAPVPPKAAAQPQLTAAVPAAPEAAPPEPVAAEAPESDRGFHDALVPALFGGAAIAAGFAIWQWAERESAVDDWNSDACLDDGGTRAENCAGHKSAYESAQTWAWVAGGTALALSAAAVTLLLIEPGDRTRETAARCDAGVLALDCRVRF